MTANDHSVAETPRTAAEPGAAPGTGSTLASRSPESLTAAAIASTGSSRPERRASFLGTLPLRLDVRIPLPNFRFKDLTALRPGQVLASEWAVSEDLPVAAGDVRLVWAEFAVAEQQLTVRVTRVA